MRRERERTREYFYLPKDYHVRYTWCSSAPGIAYPSNKKKKRRRSKMSFSPLNAKTGYALCRYIEYIYTVNIYLYFVRMHILYVQQAWITPYVQQAWSLRAEGRRKRVVIYFLVWLRNRRHMLTLRPSGVGGGKGRWGEVWEGSVEGGLYQYGGYVWYWGSTTVYP